MAFINYSTKNVAVKIVYYGPGLSGKTTNLRYIYSRMDPSSSGALICLDTATERTYFFDLLPIKAGLIQEYKVHFQLMTVPGQVFYAASRKSVLKGADGVVFVADSQVPLMEANLESFDGLKKNLLDYNIDIQSMPLVLQYNKRDLENLIPVENFNSLLNTGGFPFVESSAILGEGVFETLKEIARLTVPNVRRTIVGEDIVREEGEGKQKITEVWAEDRTEHQKDAPFDQSQEKSPIRLTKIKFRSQHEVDEEVENMAREITGKSRK